MNSRNKKIILILLVVILTLPLLQFFTNIVVVKKLSGYFKEISKPKFSWNKWFDNSFQDQYDQYFNQKFGFRDDFVRLHNQVDYSFFKELHANSVIVGKDEYLYEKNYIKSYLGEDYIGADQIQSTVKTMDSIYQILKQHQTEMLVILAPGKGYFYPEYIPDELMHERGPTNYEGYARELAKSDIPYIDFNDLFLKMKDTSSIVLYPKTGIHWSQASIPFVLDSIIKKSESILNIDMPDVHYSYKKPVSRADRQDADIERGLNLFLPLKIPKMTYPVVSFETDTSLVKPKLISIADSFFWQFFGKGYTKQSFSDVQFWYYYKQVYGTDQKELLVDDIHIRKELFDTDLVILIATDANLYKFPYGFTKALEPTKFDQKETEAKIQNAMEYIKTQNAWMKKIKQKAKERNISLDSMLYLDAKYMIDKQK